MIPDPLQNPAGDHDAIVNRTRRWIADVVIGLNLCPFASRVFGGEKIRYVVTDADQERELLRDLRAELKSLASAPLAEVETTLLIHPRLFQDFLDYNDFLDSADQLIFELGLEGVIQVASFHPNYQFAGTDPAAVENYTNRSPYPMLHLLREESVSAVADIADDLAEIPERNIATLRELGTEKILQMLREVRADPAKPGP